MSGVNLDPWTDIVNVQWGGIFAVILDLTLPDFQAVILGDFAGVDFSLAPANPGGKIRKTDWHSVDISEFGFDDFAGGWVPLGAYGSDGVDPFFNKRKSWIFNLNTGFPKHQGDTYSDAAGGSHPLPKASYSISVNTFAGLGFASGGAQPSILRIRGYRTPTDFTVASGFEVESDAGTLVFDTTDTAETPSRGGRIVEWLFDKTGIVSRTEQDFP